MNRIFFSRQNRILAFLLLGLFLLNIADYAFTVRALSWGVPEANPFMNAIVFTALFPAVKIGLVTVSLLAIWFLRNRINRLRRVIMLALWATFLVYAGTTAWHAYWQFFS